MKNRRRILGIVAAMLLAVVGTVSLIVYVDRTTEEAVADEALVDVYVVDRFVPKGADAATIRESVTIEQVPARLEQEGVITELADLGDEVAAADLQPGDQLVEARMTARDVVAEVVDDKVQVSMLLDAHRAVGGALEAGDLVGVYITFESFDAVGIPFPEQPTPEASAILTAADPDGATDAADAEATAPDATPGDDLPDKTPITTRLEFQHVLVTNVQTIDAPALPADGGGSGATSEVDGASDDEPAVEQVTDRQYVVTLALSPEESERFVFAAEFGHIWLSIDPATVEDDGTRRVELGDVFEAVTR